jgi:hypothetical protein
MFAPFKYGKLLHRTELAKPGNTDGAALDPSVEPDSSTQFRT